MIVQITQDIRKRVTDAFADLVGQDEAIQMMRRKAAVALTHTPPQLGETLLLSGPASTGKTELSKRLAVILDLPFVEIDGKAVQKREQLVKMLETACEARGRGFARSGDQSGMPIFTAPSTLAFVDEAHLLSIDLQDALLTLLEPKTKRVTVNHPDGKRIINMPNLCVVLATTHPGELTDAFRSRCNEIRLRRYTTPEVSEMVRRRMPIVPEAISSLIANVSRCTPRQAFMLLNDALEDSAWSQESDLDKCVRRVARERGIVSANGLTRNDEKYLGMLHRNGARPGMDTKAIALNTIIGLLYDVQRAIVMDEIEPWLIYLGYITVVPGGRKLTGAGERYVNDMHALADLPNTRSRDVAVAPNTDWKRAAAGDKD